MSRSLPLLIAAAIGLLALAARAHDGLELEPPKSGPEAWNVLQLCLTNLQKLVAQQRAAEVPIQASLSIQSWRFLRESTGSDPARAALRERIAAAEKESLALGNAGLERRKAELPALLERYAATLHSLEHDYEPAVVRAPVFSCPMCRGVRELQATTPCPKCGMKLEERMIPDSDVYNTPGEPSIVITPKLASPLKAGVPAQVTLRFTRKKDGASIRVEDLRVVHTERIHLLIIDRSLTDYHHEHPRPTETPGEYAFTFTPRAPGPARIFADVTPEASRVQEYVVCDLPGEGEGLALTNRSAPTSANVDGFRLDVRWLLMPGARIRAKEPVPAEVNVTGPDGQPFRQLEPVMGTYAHLVGFHEDGETVLHMHPSGGGDPQAPTDRGGPKFKFIFYAPKAGFIRLFAQVQIGGEQRFFPLGVVVAE